ncbi:SLATT domain-containing protein [Variovorax sp. KK3]|uniref:SLATT domain-containing protein n=1 Tax=Variovorax sp. KK3 TaxID=1855728 RepID=UPI00097C4887|nr:SLATT domain-containing protein [Variovorax sp. KK3]
MSAEPTASIQLFEPAFDSGDPASHQQQQQQQPRQHAETQLAFVYRQIEATYSKRLKLAKWYRRLNFGYQMSAAALSALVTVITGFQTMSSDKSIVAANVVLVISAIITLITLAGGFYTPRELWVVIMQHCGELENLKAQLEFEERSPDYEARQDEIAIWGFKEYERLIDEYEAKWKVIREKGK